MAIEAGDGLVVHEGYPSELSTDLIGEAAYKEPRHQKKANRIRLEKEHNMSAAVMGTSGAGGEHLPGSAKLYGGNYSVAWPTKRPDGLTDLDTDDTGRIAIDTTTSPNRVAVYIHGTGWVCAGLLLGSTLLCPSEIKIAERTGDPTNVANYGFLYTKDVDGATELFYIDAAGNIKQITAAGKLNIVAADIAADLLDDTKIRLRNAQALRWRNAAGDGDVNGPQVNASDKLQLPDASQLATSAAPTTDAQIPNKKYVDDQIDATVGSGTANPLSYVGGQSVTFPNGLIMKFGSVTVSPNATEDVVYDVPFPNAFVVAFATYKSTSTALVDPVGVFPKSGSEKTTLQVTNSHSSSSYTFYWFAIGY